MGYGIPAPLDSDDDDVAWALQTAQVQWKRGAVADAIVWLRRAVDAAIACGRAERATELNGVAANLTEQMLAHAGGPIIHAPTHSDVDDLLGGPTGRESIDVEIDDQTISEHQNPFEQPLLPQNNPFAQPTAQAPWDAPPPRGPAESVTTLMQDPSDSALPIASAYGVPSEALSAALPVASSELELDPRSAAMVSESELIVEPPLPPDDHVEAPTEISRFPSSLLPPSASSADAMDPGRPTETDAAQPIFDSEAPTAVANESDLLQDSEPERTAVMPPPESVAPESIAAESVAPDSESVASEPAATEPTAAPTATEPAATELQDEPSALLEGVNLAEVAGLEDLPPEAQAAMAAKARVEVLDLDEEVNQFAVALVLDGWVSIMPAIADAACAHATRGDVVFTAGSLDERVQLRVVAGESDTRVAVWDAEALTDATEDCPWVADELRTVADRFQALAGATMGPLGDRLDDGLRAEVTKRCEVRRLLPGEVFVEAGANVPGLYIIGVGSVELVSPDGSSVTEELAAGDFLFASAVMSAGSAPATARAGQGGALLLFAERHAAHELMVSVPPLLEMLAG